MLKKFLMKRFMKIKRISKIKKEEDLRIEEIMSDKPRKPINENPNLYISTYQSLSNYPKEFFHQFHTVACDEAHGAKATTLTTILKRTFGHAYNRFGVSGTFPSDDTLEILTIQSVLGPKVTQIEASALVKSGTITPMEIRAVILNHATGEMNDRLSAIRKMGAGAEAYRYEKEYVQQSEKRLEFIKKIISKFNQNGLVLFHTIEYGNRLFEKFKAEMTDKDFYYIDGGVSSKNRDLIKSEMEKVGDKPKILIASYGTVGTGYSIKNLHYLILADSYKSEQIVIQAIGRVLRLFTGKKEAIIYDIVDLFDPKGLNNTLYKHYLERKKFYDSRSYPHKEFKINL